MELSGRKERREEESHCGFDADISHRSMQSETPRFFPSLSHNIKKSMAASLQHRTKDTAANTAAELPGNNISYRPHPSLCTQTSSPLTHWTLKNTTLQLSWTRPGLVHRINSLVTHLHQWIPVETHLRTTREAQSVSRHEHAHNSPGGGWTAYIHRREARPGVTSLRVSWVMISRSYTLCATV